MVFPPAAGTRFRRPARGIIPSKTSLRRWARDRLVFYVIVSLVIAGYVGNYAVETWRTGNRFGAVGLSVLAVLVVAAWVWAYAASIR